jgi:hypothetical protein
VSLARACLLLCALALLTLARDALADEPVPAPAAGLEIAASPLLGESAISPGSWAEVLVVIKNVAAEPRSGSVTAIGFRRYNGQIGNTNRTPFSVAPNATVQFRLPLKVGAEGDPGVTIHGSDGRLLFERNFSRMNHNRTMLVDVGTTSALNLHLGGVPVGSLNDPWAANGYGSMGSRSSHGSGGGTVVEVTQPLLDQATSEPLLPVRSASYARVAAVLIRSDTLAQLPAAELAALAGWTLAGGTVAIVIVRPEDMRHTTLTSLVGGEVKKTELAPETLAPVTLMAPRGGAGFGQKGQPVEQPYSDELGALLSGYQGGNLRPSSYGASAPYGLGEVHLLAFDPQKRPAVDSEWAQVRMVDLLRRANERRLGVVFRLGDEQQPDERVRQYLDPNESSRWGIIVTALLLCIYAVAAGPINFTIWRRRGHPLKALPSLALFSALAFGAVVGIGVISKGCSGRARHLAFIDAGAGMKVGSAWRWRGFFVPSARSMTVRASHAASVLGAEIESFDDRGTDALVFDREGLRLTGLELRPWQTTVVREDGFASLGGGISLVKEGSDTKVVNRTGRALRALVLWEPPMKTSFLARLESGASAKSADFAVKSVHNTRVAAGFTINEFRPDRIQEDADRAASNVTAAWLAVKARVPASTSWFPSDVPVLLAQIEGGEGDTSDSGLTMDHDRVLVRVVGYGGEP